MNRAKVASLAVLVAASSVLFQVAYSTLIVPMSFEEAAKGADVVVLGTVRMTPKLGEFDPAAKTVVRRHTVHVDKYLKGNGASSITVVTVGGDFIKETPEGPQRMSMDAAGMPDLPTEGTPVLLFLKRYVADDTYLIYSASHGVVPVEEVGPSKEASVTLRFRSAEAMPKRVRLAYEDEKARGRSTDTLFTAAVPVSTLSKVFEKVLR